MAVGPTPSLSDSPAGEPAPSLSRRRPIPWSALGWFLLLLVALQLIVGPIVRLSQWHVDAAANTNYAEALAWHNNRLDIGARTHDSALHNGKVYSVNAPLFTLISYLAIWLAKLQGLPTYEFYSPWYFAAVALPLPFVGFAVFQRAIGEPRWAALLTLAWIAATPVLACLAVAREGGINHINHLLSQTGLFLIAASLICGGRLRWALIGLVWATWSRPLSIFFALPIAWMAWKRDGGRRASNLMATLGATGLAIGVTMALNHLKFGSALESGYRFVYEGRNDEMARRGKAALFSTSYLKRNAWYMNAEIPGWSVGKFGIRPETDPYGGSIWFTMPILLYAITTARQWWSSPPRRWAMLTSLVVIGLLLCYHNTGYIQPGYFRYSLDWLPIWLTVIAAATCRSTKSRNLTIAAIAWSLLYFNLIMTTSA